MNPFVASSRLVDESTHTHFASSTWGHTMPWVRRVICVLKLFKLSPRSPSRHLSCRKRSPDGKTIIYYSAPRRLYRLLSNSQLYEIGSTTVHKSSITCLRQSTLANTNGNERHTTRSCPIADLPNSTSDTQYIL
jgi:hypothetical protein